MKKDQIAALLNKYWRCETTVAEEQELRRFFAEEELPEELQQYAPLFSYIAEEHAPRLSRGFDRRLEESLRHAGATPLRQQRIPRRAMLMRVAASFLLIVGLGVSLFFITRQQNNPHFTERGDEDTQVLEQATEALEKLADALLMSEEASRETLRQINELEIDWELIDSLSSDTTPEEADPVTEIDDAEEPHPAVDSWQENEKAIYNEMSKREEKI